MINIVTVSIYNTYRDRYQELTRSTKWASISRECFKEQQIRLFGLAL